MIASPYTLKVFQEITLHNYHKILFRESCHFLLKKYVGTVSSFLYQTLQVTLQKVNMLIW
jgi:hypothetical protein